MPDRTKYDKAIIIFITASAVMIYGTLVKQRPWAGRSATRLGFMIIFIYNKYKKSQQINKKLRKQYIIFILT